MSLLHEELAACLARVKGLYQQALKVKNDQKRRFNAVPTELDDLKVTLHDLKKEKTELQRTIGEKNMKAKQREAKSHNAIATFNQSHEYKKSRIESFC